MSDFCLFRTTLDSSNEGMTGLSCGVVGPKIVNRSIGWSLAESYGGCAWPESYAHGVEEAGVRNRT
jgi:hypothetical protein